MPSFTKRILTPLLALLLLLNYSLAEAPLLILKEREQSELKLTLYQYDLALIEERYLLHLPKGHSHIALTRLPTEMDSDSLQISISQPNDLKLLSRVTQSRGLNPDTLYQANLNQKVIIESVDPKTGILQREEAKLLAYQPTPIVEFSNHWVTLLTDEMQLYFPALPEALSSAPYSTLYLEKKSEGVTPIDLTYLTQGLSWRANYVALLKDEELQLSANYTLLNKSDRSFNNAILTLVTGTPNQRYHPLQAKMELAPMMHAAADLTREEVPLTGYQTYSLPNRVTLNSNEEVTLPLFSDESLPYHTEYRFELQHPYNAPLTIEQPQPAQLFLYFTYDQPLPPGTLYLYKEGESTHQLFLGSDQIPVTPAGQKISITVGNYDALTATQYARDRSRLHDHGIKTDYELQIANSSDSDQEIALYLTLPEEKLWSIDSPKHPVKRVRFNRYLWQISVPAQETIHLNYQLNEHPKPQEGSL